MQGFGFIFPDPRDTEQIDIFVHFKEIQTDGHFIGQRELVKGMEVSYLLREENGKPQAAKVRLSNGLPISELVVMAAHQAHGELGPRGGPMHSGYGGAKYAAQSVASHAGPVAGHKDDTHWSALPPGWEQIRTAEGVIYYHDQNTKTTHWQLPARCSLS